MTPTIVGIDVASRKLDVCLLKEGQEHHVTIPNTKPALRDFLKTHNLTKSNCLVGLEATGDYSRLAVRYLLQRGIITRLLNPIVTKRYMTTQVRGKKTDKSDAANIARLTADGEGELVTPETVDDRDKELLRLSRFLLDRKVQLTLHLHSLRRKQLPKTKRIARKLEKITAMLQAISDELVTEATTDRSRDEELIDSIPGFSVKLSAVVHHELGDISRFKNARSLDAFAGLDPKVKQSGGKLHTSGRLTKRGSPHLRSALFMAAHVASMYEPELKTYYHKKKQEGRSHKEVCCIIARKLLHRIWAVIRDQREYVVKSEQQSNEMGLQAE